LPNFIFHEAERMCGIRPDLAPASAAVTDESLVSATVFFCRKNAQDAQKKPEGIHFFVVVVPLCG